MGPIGMVASLRQEISPLLKRVAPVRRDSLDHRNLYGFESGAKEILLLETGIGGSNALNGLHSLIKAGYDLSVLISFGFAGALSPEQGVGDVIYGKKIGLYGSGTRCLDLSLHTHFFHDGLRGLQGNARSLPLKEGSIITVEQLTSKASLASVTPPDLPCPVVDMESYFIAKEALKNEIPFICLRGISDAFQEEIHLDLSSVTDSKQRIQPLKTLRYVMGRPGFLPQFYRLWRNSTLAARNLSYVLLRVLDGLTPES